MKKNQMIFLKVVIPNQVFKEIEKEKSLIAIEKKLELEKAELKKLQEDILNQRIKIYQLKL